MIKQQKITKAAKEAKIKQTLERFNMLSLIDQNATALSGGQKKRVAIARAYLQNADIYLFDEPSANIDISTNIKIEHIIKMLISEGKKVILSTHDTAQISRLLDPTRDEVIILQKGRVIAQKNQFNLNQIIHLL